MGTMTISLPDDILEYVEEQLGEDFADSSAFLAELVRKDQEERTAELKQIVSEALASGMSNHSIDDIFERAVERVRAKGTLLD